MSSKTSRDKNLKEIKTAKFFSPSEFDDNCSNDDSYYHEKQKEIFKNEVLDLIDKNKNLVSKVDEQNYEIAELKCKIDTLNDIINSEQLDIVGKGSNIASNKIIDLSKKNRQLTAELQAFKCKYGLLEAQNKILETESKEKVSDGDGIGDGIGDVEYPPEHELKSQLNSLQTKLGITSSKLCEVLSQNSQLKNDLKLAQKCIQQEIGENMTLQALSQGNSNWRGRAQQICNLQSKICDLKIRLSENCTPDDKCKPKRETNKSCEIDALKKDLAIANQTIDELTFKISALKARGKILNEECAACKAKSLLLLDKSKLDEEYIKELNCKIVLVKDKFENTLYEMEHKVTKTQQEKEELKIQVTQLLLKLENAENTDNNTAGVIQKLKDRIEDLEKDLRGVAGEFLFSCKDFKKDHFLGLLDALEQEKLGLLEHIQDCDHQLDQEKEKCLQVRNQLKAAQIKLAKTEIKLKQANAEMTELLEKKKGKSRTTAKEPVSFDPNAPPSTPLTCMESKIEELRFKMELAEERIMLLREKIIETQNSKTESLKKVTAIIQNSKNLMVECLRKQLVKPHDYSNEPQEMEAECSFSESLDQI